jgi:hypothetical protein
MSVTLQVMIPEDTFRPQILNGLTVDVSERGMQVSIAALPLNLYSKLLSRPRNVRVAFDPPGGGDEIKLLGRISWIDYRKPKADERAGPCRLGVFFDAKDGCDLKPYSQFIAAIDPA